VRLRKFLLSLLALPFIMACANSETSLPPQARAGVLDLRDWDWNKTALIELRGDWDFWWDSLIDPDDPDQTPASIAVPSRWSLLAPGEEKFPANGEASYRLQILLPEDGPPLGLRLREIDRAYRLWINGAEYETGFQVSETAAAESGTGVTRDYFFSSGKTLTLVLHVTSHWDSWGGGIPYTPTLGTAPAVSQQRAINAAYEVLPTGILLIMVLYHLMLYFVARRDLALLAFSLICLTAMLRHLVMNEGFLLTEAHISDEFIRRASWFTAYLLSALYLWFTGLFFPRHRMKWVSRILFTLGGLMTVTGLVAPQSFYGLALLLDGYLIAVIAVIVVVVSRAIAEKVRFGWILLAGTVSAAIPALIDIGSINSGVISVFIGPLGVVPFLITLSYVLAQRYSQGTRDAEELRIRNLRLTELDQAKTNFFANISHELRTPLTLLLGPLQGIQKGDYGAELKPKDEVFAKMKGNAERILHLVESLLNAAKLEAGEKPVLRVLNLAQTTSGYVEDFSSTALTAGISLEWNCLLKPEESLVLMDSQDWQTIVFNLLSNALKYTEPGGTVSVELTRAGEQLILSVSDTGIGIAPERMHQLFQRFKRIYEQERGDYQGTGIGLSIARQAALHLGGDLEASSVLGKGSRFVARVPFSAASNPVEASGPIPKAAKALKQERLPSLLVVEDQAEMRSYLQFLLRKDFTVLTAGDGGAALEVLQQNPQVELILSDIMMPNVDGVALFEAVRRHSSFSAIPFLFLTARASPEERLERLQDGAIDYLTKPFVAEELRAKLTSLMDWKRRQGKGEEGQGAIKISEDFGLSPREKEILVLVSQGKTDKEIAIVLELSPRTASNHVSNLLRKTGCSSRSGLIALAKG